MTFVLNTELAGPSNNNGDARPTITKRRYDRHVREILPGLLLNSIVAGAAFAVRLLPGMTTFSPMILSIVIGMAFHNIVGTAAWARPA